MQVTWHLALAFFLCPLAWFSPLGKGSSPGLAQAWDSGYDPGLNDRNFLLIKSRKALAGKSEPASDPYFWRENIR